MLIGRKPPSGVFVGPFSATRRSRIDSITRSGSGVPSRSQVSKPASWTSHSISTPVASSARRAASVTSGPTPSPGIRVTRWAMPARLLARDQVHDAVLGEPAYVCLGVRAERRDLLAAVQRLQDLELGLIERQRRLTAPDLRLADLEVVATVEMVELLELARRLHDCAADVAVRLQQLPRPALALDRVRVLAERVVVEVVELQVEVHRPRR